MRLRDRESAGRILSERLSAYRAECPIVIALPRGGVPVACEIARELEAPLDVIIVRKLGAPCDPELAIGAVSEDQEVILNRNIVEVFGVSQAAVEAIAARAGLEVSERLKKFRGGRPALPVAGRTVILVDDGLATGATLLAAIRFLRKKGAARVIAAVPVCSQNAADRVRSKADELVSLVESRHFASVSQWYEDFVEVSDAEVERLLAATSGTASGPTPAPGPAPTPTPTPTDVEGLQLRFGGRQEIRTRKFVNLASG